VGEPQDDEVVWVAFGRDLPRTPAEIVGPKRPLRRTARRRPGSLRRTSSVDTQRPNGFAQPATVVGRARDLATEADGATKVVAEASLDATVGADRALHAIVTTPLVRRLDDLVGLSIGGGFRGRLATVGAGEVDDGSVLHLLLDDLVGATLVSGYAAQRSLPFSFATMGPDVMGRVIDNVDVCAGWIEGGSIMRSLRGDEGSVPTPFGPVAPLLEADDPGGWHELPALPPFAMRRRRCLDLLPRDEPDRRQRQFDAHFRDSYVDDQGAETVVHEYSVRGAIDTARREITAIEVDGRVLPWVECPSAVASAGRVVGHAVGDLRAFVRAGFVGTSTCTHLNDVLRCLADLDTLFEVAPA